VGGEDRQPMETHQRSHLTALPHLSLLQAGVLRLQARVRAQILVGQVAQADSRAVRSRRMRAVEARAERPPLPAFSCAVSTFRSSIYACRACNILGRLGAIAVHRTGKQSAPRGSGLSTKC
jgi:hypothetical protein